jgi:hypothetical protein
MSDQFIPSWLREPSLDEMSRTPRATTKGELKTRMDRAIEKKQDKREDERKLAIWAKAVKARDKWKDRLTGRQVKKPGKVSIIDPDVAHAHHGEPRENYDVRYDVRNGICLSAATHEKVERNELAIVGKHYFVVKGRRYLNLSKPVKFVPATARKSA